jgi:pyridoxal phosphate-dependent aminotransferase EpsN
MGFEIFLSPPHLTGMEIAKVRRAFERNELALGAEIEAFESEIAAYLGAGQHAVAVGSGTAAIHLALLVLGVGPGDTVLCSDLTVAASANPIRYCGAEPVFVDCDPDTWNVSVAAAQRAIAELAREGRRPKAAIWVNLYGQSADFDPLRALCGENAIPIVEDAAESLGATYRGRKSATLGDLSVLSFNGNKIITSSGGGVLLSADRDRISRARCLANQAREPAPHYQHEAIGYNYRMSNIAAAIGRAQLVALEARVAARRAIFDRYRAALGGLPGVGFIAEAGYGVSNRWLTVMTLEPGVARSRPSDIIGHLAAGLVESRPVWKPMHRQPAMSGCRYYRATEHSVSGHCFERGVCLPSGSALSPAEQDRIIAEIRRVLI